jgi:hypothetical protein
MTEMLFAKPGAVAVYPKTMSNLSQMMGYPVGGNPLVPDSDQIIPEWIQNRGAVPLYSHNGNTVFYDPSNPFNDTVRTWQGNNPREALTGQAEIMAGAAMANPLARIPTELAFGRTAFGNQDIKGKELQYLQQQSPQSSFISNLLSGNTSSDLQAQDRITSPESVNKLLAGGTIENTDKRQASEMQRLQDILNVQRKDARKKKGWPDPR